MLVFVFCAGNIRNLAMEKVANSVFFPCKYSSTGCPALLSHSDKPEREEACEFRYLHFLNSILTDLGAHASEVAKFLERNFY